MFITFEGIDCSGKSTQCRLLEKLLIDKGYDVIAIREPGGTIISEKIRQLLLDKNLDSMTSQTELLLYSASRAQLVNEVIKPALDSGKIVICDRFYDSTTAYQGFGRGLPVEDIEHINRFSSNNLAPDLTVIVDISVEESLRRLKLAGKSADRIESEGKDFFEAVRQGYLHFVTQSNVSSEVTKRRYKVINGEDDVNTIKQNILQIVINEIDKFK
jgi:dTMP kinase